MMKDNRKYPYQCWQLCFLVCVAICSLCACEFHTGDNGDLDGFWHLESIEDLQTGEVRYVGDEKLFWSYEVSLMYLQGASTGAFYLRFLHADNTLTIYEPRESVWHNGEEGNPLVTDASVLLPYGITALEESFQVEKLNGGTMILCSEVYRLKFEKF